MSDCKLENQNFLQAVEKQVLIGRVAQLRAHQHPTTLHLFPAAFTRS